LRQHICASLAESKGFFIDFLISSNLRGLKILNPGLCILAADGESDPLWGDDDLVHPL
jgi:hypothetical protein